MNTRSVIAYALVALLVAATLDVTKACKKCGISACGCHGGHKHGLGHGLYGGVALPVPPPAITVGPPAPLCLHHGLSTNLELGAGYKHHHHGLHHGLHLGAGYGLNAGLHLGGAYGLEAGYGPPLLPLPLPPPSPYIYGGGYLPKRRSYWRPRCRCY